MRKGQGNKVLNTSEPSIADLHMHDLSRNRTEAQCLNREVKQGTGEACYRNECTRHESNKRQKIMKKSNGLDMIWNVFNIPKLLFYAPSTFA